MSFRTMEDAVADKIVVQRGDEPPLRDIYIQVPPRLDMSSLAPLRFVKGDEIIETYALRYTIYSECPYGWVYTFNGVERTS